MPFVHCYACPASSCTHIIFKKKLLACISFPVKPQGLLGFYVCFDLSAPCIFRSLRGAAIAARAEAGCGDHQDIIIGEA